MDANISLQRILRVKAQAAACAGQASKLEQDLQQKIADGKATLGNLFANFVYLRYCDKSAVARAEIEAVYRFIDQRVSEHKGELVLVVTKQEVFVSDFQSRLLGSYEQEFYTIDVGLYLGSLCGDRLVINMGHTFPYCELPTEKYVKHIHDRRHSTRTVLVEGNIADWGMVGMPNFANTNKPLELHDSCLNNSGQQHLELEILFGENEIMVWLDKYQGEFTKRKRILDYFSTLREMAQLLGRTLNIPEPPEITTARQKRIEETIYELTKLVIECDELKRRPDRFSQPVSVMHAGVEDKIRKVLKTLHELGVAGDQFLSMGLLPTLEQLYEQYHVGTSARAAKDH